MYLTQCREADYDLPEAVQTAVTDDFVQLRQEDPNQFTPEDLHSHLILARLGNTKAKQTLFLDGSIRSGHPILRKNSKIKLED